MDNLTGLYYDTPPSRSEAEAAQRELQKRVITKNDFEKIETVAGADIAIVSDEKKLVCGIIVFSYPDLKEIERVSVKCDEKFPYIPGLLSFREGPAIIEAFGNLKNKPDALMIDGQGIAHPRGLGIASHVGVLLNVPAIGVAKSRLYGKYNEPPDSAGSWTPLVSPYKGTTVGAVVRTKKGTKPVFVSIGHKVDLKTAVRVALDCARGYRIPEPTRQADIYAAQLKKQDA